MSSMTRGQGSPGTLWGGAVGQCTAPSAGWGGDSGQCRQGGSSPSFVLSGCEFWAHGGVNPKQ